MSVESLITEHIDIWTSAIKAKSASGRGSSKKVELYGIKKLRELILELAVRGKLVPQDPSDEPASKLLERIAEEKAQLIKSKKISKTQKLPSLTEEEKSISIPSGWALCRFGDLYHLEYGNNLPKEKRSGSGEYPVYGSNGVVGTHNDFSVNEACVVIGRKGSAGALNMSTTPCWVTDVAYSVIPPAGIELNYCFFHLNTFGLDSLGKGIKPGLNRNEANVLIACIPPTAEQHRIVSKVDELMALCDQLESQTENQLETYQQLVQTLLDTLTNCKNHAELQQNWALLAQNFDALFTTEQSIDLLKKTILQLAVMGKLVPQDPNDEPASKLLERIAAEKAQLIIEKKIKKQKALPPISEDEKPFELPSGWEWCKFGELSQFINGDRGKNYPNKNEYVEDGIPWINTGHIEPDGTLTTSEMNFITEEKFDSLRGGKIEVGDLVYCLRGATFGKTAFVTPYITGAIASSLMIIRAFDFRMNGFIFRYLTSTLGRSQIFRFDNGSAQPNLSANSVGLYAFPCPPLQEQHRIVAKVDELMTICDDLKSKLALSQQTQLHLTDAIVEQVA